MKALPASPLKEILTLQDKITYIGITHNLGRAEFQICPKFTRGKLTDLYIYRRQQENRESYHINIKVNCAWAKITTFLIDAWTHRTEPPRIWRNFWCKEHKTICFEVYVPPETDTIEFDENFGDTLTIRFIKAEVYA